MQDFDAVILAGGAGRRLAGADKAELDVGGVRLLDRAIEAVAAAGRIVVVGPRRPIANDHVVFTQDDHVVFTQEEPAGSGPAAALMRGLELVQTALVVALAVDVPFASSAVERVLGALSRQPDRDAAMLVDKAGRRQPLLAAYRTAALDGRRGDWVNRPMHALTAGLAVIEVAAEALEALDCDTPGDLRQARRAAQTNLNSAAVAPRPSRRTPRTPPAR